MKKPIKKCLNPECGDAIITYKSAKKNYCNDYCRNRAGFIKRAEENKGFLLIDKQLKENKKILKNFIDRDVYEIPTSTLTLLGFKSETLLNGQYYSIKDKNVYLFKIDNIYFESNTERKSIIIHKIK